MANKHTIKRGLLVNEAEGDAIIVEGVLGEVYSVTADLTGVLHSVADVSGVPIFKVEDTGVSTFWGPVVGVTPTADSHLATKAYVDAGGGGTIGGSLASTQIAYGTAANTIGGSNNFIWNGDQCIITNDGTIAVMELTGTSNTGYVALRFNAGPVNDQDVYMISYGSTHGALPNQTHFKNLNNAGAIAFSVGGSAAADIVCSFFPTYVDSKDFRPKASATYDFGTASLKWKDGYFSGTLSAGNLSGTNTGDDPGVTAVNNGSGMNFTNITGTGTVTLGTPSSLSGSSTNAVTASSHTHVITTGAVANTSVICSGADIITYVTGLGYGTGTMSSWTLLASSGTPQTISNGNTVNLASGNGISTTAAATDKVTFALEALSANWDGGATYTITANDFILGSDKKLKTNITPLKGGVNARYVEFEYKTNKGRRRAGVIANELVKEHPELVHGEENEILSVSYTDLLIREVAGLKDEVISLKDENNDLKTRLEALERFVYNT